MSLTSIALNIISDIYRAPKCIVVETAYYISPLTERWGHVALLSVRSVPFISASAFYRVGGQTRELTQCLANVRPPSTTLSQHYPCIRLPWRHAECGPASQTAGQH